MTTIALTDLETTGLYPEYHEIVEIACIMFDEDSPGEGRTWEKKVWPQFPERMDPAAQKVNGYSREEWKAAGAVPLEVALREYTIFTKGALFMSYNVAFDAGFLNFAFRKVGIKSELARPYLDLLTMAYDRITQHGSEPLNWRMASVCKHLGIPPEPAVHRALNGVMAEWGIYRALREHDV